MAKRPAWTFSAHVPKASVQNMVTKATKSCHMKYWSHACLLTSIIIHIINMGGELQVVYQRAYAVPGSR
jgi:hypothetical protein